MADEPGVVSGYLLLSADKGHSWNKRWMVVHNNAMMYCFKTNKVQTVRSIDSDRLHVRLEFVFSAKAFCIKSVQFRIQ